MKFITLILILLINLFSFSQENNSINKDAMLWTGAALKAKLIKKLTVKYETQTRFYKNASTLLTYYNELGGKYEPVKNLTIGLSYRYSRKNKEEYFTNENRFSLNLAYAYKIEPANIRLKARIRFQNSFDRLKIIEPSIYPNIKNVLRFKLDLKYNNPNFKRVQPYINYEIYRALNPQNNISIIDTYRFSVGIDFDLPHKNEISIFYIFENENRKVINQNHVYGIQYTYSLGKLIDSPDNSRY